MCGMQREGGLQPPMEIDLVRRACRGDEQAYHIIVDRYSPQLYRLAYSLVGNTADAEDVLQETLLGAFQGLARFQARSSLKTWLVRILVRQAGRCRQRRARHRTMALDAAEVGERTPGSPDPEQGAHMDLTDALEALAPLHREVIMLREIQGFSYEEIATALGVPRGTVESRLFRARRVLRDRLKDYLPTEPPPGEAGGEEA